MANEEYDSSKWFVVMWCSEGMECVVPVTDIDRDHTFNLLKTGGTRGSASSQEIVNMLMLRARFNPQRYYEIYAVSATEGIEKEDIEQMFENDPQSAADTIREKGQKIYSDRATRKAAIY